MATEILEKREQREVRKRSVEALGEAVSFLLVSFDTDDVPRVRAVGLTRADLAYIGAFLTHLSLADDEEEG